MKKLLIIGAGPGGYVAAIRGAQLGADVTLVENHKIGGTCLNYGCIPTKTLYRNAEILKTLSHIGDFGISVGQVTIDPAAIQARKQEVVDTLVGGIEQLIKANGIRLLEGHATFIDNQTVEVQTPEGKLRETADAILIATGSTERRPSFKGADHPDLMTSKELLNFESIPQNLLVVGGGIVGMEFASIFNAMGSKVTVLARSILKFFDKDVVKRLQPLLKKQGIQIVPITGVENIAPTDQGFDITVGTKKGPTTYSGDQVLLAAGRDPMVQGLGLEHTDIQTGPKGIIVNDQFQTDVPGVYAFGDVIGKTMLAHAASHQGVWLVESLMGLDSQVDLDTIPNCVFIFPEAASVGMTEAQAKGAGIEVLVSKFQFGANGKALALGEGQGIVKAISDTHHKLLGVQIIGPHASDLIHEPALAISKGMTVHDIASVIHAHPTLSEAVYESILGLADEAIHIAPKKKW